MEYYLLKILIAFHRVLQSSKNFSGGCVMKFMYGFRSFPLYVFVFECFGAKENIVGTAFSTCSLHGAH